MGIGLPASRPDSGHWGSGQACELTSYQFDLLLALTERAGRVLSREQIMEAVRGRELDVKSPKRILTVREVSYVFARQQD